MMHLEIIDIRNKYIGELYDTPDCQALLELYKKFYPETGFHLPWVGYFTFLNGKIAGTCGFTGAPKHGFIEIAYWTFKSYEGMGVASFGCRELLKIVRDANPSLTVCAKTLPEENASNTILKNNGFKFSEVVQDEEIGDAWLWLLQP